MPNLAQVMMHLLEASDGCAIDLVRLSRDTDPRTRAVFEAGIVLDSGMMCRMDTGPRCVCICVKSG